MPRCPAAIDRTAPSLVAGVDDDVLATRSPSRRIGACGSDAPARTSAGAEIQEMINAGERNAAREWRSEMSFMAIGSICGEKRMDSRLAGPCVRGRSISPI
jgi:hypothetical protein